MQIYDESRLFVGELPPPPPESHNQLGWGTSYFGPPCIVRWKGIFSNRRQSILFLPVKWNVKMVTGSWRNSDVMRWRISKNYFTVWNPAKHNFVYITQYFIKLSHFFVNPVYIHLFDSRFLFPLFSFFCFMEDRVSYSSTVSCLLYRQLPAENHTVCWKLIRHLIPK